MAIAPAALLLGKIGVLIENEASTISGVRDQVNDLKLELMSMVSFLEDAERKTAHTEGEKTRIAHVRDLAYDAEDIIDEFMYHMYEQRSRGVFARWLHKTIHVPKNLWYKRQIASRLERITKKIKESAERKDRYGGDVTAVEPSWEQNQAVSSQYIEEDELVGIESKKKILEGWLMHEDQQRTVMSVVGMGGSGKTTLVVKIFNSDIVKRHFDCYACITVSKTYAIKELFRSLIKEFHNSKKEEVPRNLNIMDYKELLEMLVTYLESKRYLVVLDDVWEMNLWREISIALPNSQLGSRVMLTTRMEDIAIFDFGVQERHVHYIKPLEKSEAWELFSKKAFSVCPGKCCPLELESIAWELLEKCEGLPLAIVALSGLMSFKKSHAEWSVVYESLNWHLENEQFLQPVESILWHSFNGLSYGLKHCFLYCSLFPEDYLIRRKRLFKLWISEGFAEHGKGIRPEEIAETYLKELIFRSMLQVEWRNETGRPKACKMHDLMRELALSMSEKEKFGTVYNGREEEIVARRLSIQKNDGEMKSCSGMSQLRSFIMFVTDMSNISLSSGLKLLRVLDLEYAPIDKLPMSNISLPSGLKLLRVLDLEYAPIEKLPHELVYLFNLRYLNLRGTQIKKLPKSIGRLRNLETLDIMGTNIETLPRGISNLINLRHLIMYHFTNDYVGFSYLRGTKAPSNICDLKKLQALSGIQLEGNAMKHVGKMSQLTTLGITNLKGSDETDLCVSVQNMTLLRVLYIVASKEGESLPVNAMFSAPPALQKLYLTGKLETVPPWFRSLHNLTFLYLHWSRLEEDLLPVVEALPSLGRLGLINAYAGNELCFSRGFKRLTQLQLVNNPLLNKVTIENGVAPNLQFLSLDSCKELKTLPHGLEYLTQLETLRFQSVPVELIDSIREGGVDRPKVQHIPNIDHFYETQSGMLHESLSCLL